MIDDIQYEIIGNRLIITHCPHILTSDIINELFTPLTELYCVEICEGLEVIEKEAFYSVYNLKEIYLPNSLKIIAAGAFKNCGNLVKVRLPDTMDELGESVFSNCGILESVNIPKGLSKIKNGTFFRCINLENIEIPEGVVKICKEAFSTCYCLNNVTLPSTLKIIGEYSFFDTSLENIILPENVEEIEDGAFYACGNLKSVQLPTSLKKIGNEAFSMCENLETISLPDEVFFVGKKAFKDCYCLEKVKLPNRLKLISDSLFENCEELEEVIMPNKLEKIGDRSFLQCSGLKRIEFPFSLSEIGNRAFLDCYKLDAIELPTNLLKIGEYAFSGCDNLKSLELPGSLEDVGKGAFCRCDEIKKIKINEGVKEIWPASLKLCKGLEFIELPNSLQRINCEAFSGCLSIKEIIIPDSVEIVDSFAFESCNSLEVVKMPNSLRYFGHSAFSNVKNLKKIIVYDEGKNLEIDFDGNSFFYNPDNILVFHNQIKDVYGFYYKGKYRQFDVSFLKNNKEIKNMFNKRFLVDRMYFARIYQWISKNKFIPHYVVIQNMPISDIDNFYINNNCKEWGNLISQSGIELDENKGTFFKLCYVLGVFSSKAAVRDSAVKFIRENIIAKMSEREIHSRFDGFDLKQGYNEEYANFFMKYFNTDSFMRTVDEWGMDIDLMAASYNSFSNVKKFYPNKVLNTNRESDRLLPEHVMIAIRSVVYQNVDNDNESLALLVGKYGYTQKQFNLIQELFNEGKILDGENLKLFIKKDIHSMISYDLLDKDNPLGVVLGNITNCCQVIGGTGESCVKYGMTKANSKFMTFNYNNAIIGQSWVWYDEKSKTICLDNIEVPERYCDVIKHNKKMQEEFAKCLKRVAINFKEEMKIHGLEVKSVTIGRGWNDIRDVLDEYFDLVEIPNSLGDYSEYSDAKEQYEISENIKKQK